MDAVDGCISLQHHSSKCLAIVALMLLDVQQGKWYASSAYASGVLVHIKYQAHS